MPELLDWLVKNDERFTQSRLASLYSDFQRQKTVNPDGYRANISTWQAGLRRAVRAGAGPGKTGVLALETGPKLIESLASRAYGTPSALGAVLQESISEGQFLPVDKFLAAKASVYDRSWIPSASSVAAWAVDQIGLGAWLHSPSSQGHYVIFANVEDACGQLRSVVDQSQGRLQRLVPMRLFRREVATALGLDHLSDVDLSIILVHLARDKKLIDYGKDVVKVLAVGEKKAEITKQESDIASLKDLAMRLQEQEAELTQKVQALSQETKNRLLEKDKKGALRSLKSCKAHEAILDRRAESSRQIMDMLSKIEQAADQAEMVKAMESSTSILKSITAETGGIENVERIIDQLQEETDKAEEIGTSIRASVPGANDIDEADIDEALEQLEAENKQSEEVANAEETRRKLSDILAVPIDRQSNEKQSEAAPASEQDLNSSISALNRLSLEAPTSQPDEQGKARQQVLEST